jgi:hypothetical protein
MIQRIDFSFANAAVNYLSDESFQGKEKSYAI